MHRGKRGNYLDPKDGSRLLCMYSLYFFDQSTRRRSRAATILNKPPSGKVIGYLHESDNYVTLDQWFSTQGRIA